MGWPRLCPRVPANGRTAYHVPIPSFVQHPAGTRKMYFLVQKCYCGDMRGSQEPRGPATLLSPSVRAWMVSILPLSQVGGGGKARAAAVSFASLSKSLARKAGCAGPLRCRSSVVEVQRPFTPSIRIIARGATGSRTISKSHDDALPNSRGLFGAQRPRRLRSPAPTRTIGHGTTSLGANPW